MPFFSDRKRPAECSAGCCTGSEVPEVMHHWTTGSHGSVMHAVETAAHGRTALPAPGVHKGAEPETAAHAAAEAAVIPARTKGRRDQDEEHEEIKRGATSFTGYLYAIGSFPAVR